MSSTQSLLEKIAGVDEAGRGPLAGPVYAAAVILDPSRPISGLADSKKLSFKQRNQLFGDIRTNAFAWSIATASVREIDEINILQASLLAMQRAIAGLEFTPTRVLVDGNKLPQLSCPAEAIVKGDERIAEISAASILAKVARDEEMVRLDKEYPGYGMATHKGYPTRAHLAALGKNGVTPIHRRTFAPVRRLLES